MATLNDHEEPSKSQSRSVVVERLNWFQPTNAFQCRVWIGRRGSSYIATIPRIPSVEVEAETEEDAIKVVRAEYAKHVAFRLGSWQSMFPALDPSMLEKPKEVSERLILVDLGEQDPDAAYSEDFLTQADILRLKEIESSGRIAPPGSILPQRKR
ncbi:MAG: hypothetical protein U1A77_14010 [Pirellulales bacterium]